MSNQPAKHFNKGTVWGRVDGVPRRKLSNEGKGDPYWTIKVICPSYRGNAFAFGRIRNEEKAEALIDYLKKNPHGGVKLVGFFNQYEKDGSRLSNFSWYDWQPHACEDPRAAFVLVGRVEGVQDDTLALVLEREGSDPEDLEVYALSAGALKGFTEGDVVEVKGYLRSKEPEGEFGETNNSPIRPYIEQINLREGDFK